MRKSKRAEKLITTLEGIYARYHKREFVDPDPLLFLYDYPQPRDREIAGLIAASLAYGRVTMIMKTVDQVLSVMGVSPYGFLEINSPARLNQAFKGFKYRFSTQAHLVALLVGIQGILEDFGSLNACFLGGRLKARKNEDAVLAGLSHLYHHLSGTGELGHLMADPGKTSACKRSHLYLRWMVRQDGVDPGGWTGVNPADLVVPIDTHMYKIGTCLKFTKRKAADKACALEITKGFRRLCPQDPVRYDFSLTRMGIHSRLEFKAIEGILLGKNKQAG